MNDLIGMAARLAEELTDTLDVETISYLALLDALASAGVTLTPDTDGDDAAKHWLCTGCGYTYTSYAADQEPKQHGHCQRGIWARISKAHRV